VPLAMAPGMTKSLAAALVIAVTCVLEASCLRGNPEEDATTPPAASSEPSGPEPIGEDREQLPIVSYKPEDFPFRIIVRDDGKGKGGGWQAARADLGFWHVVLPHWPQRWRCVLTVEMPLRTKAAGPISSSEAAIFSVEIAEDVARAMDYDLPQGIFCRRFVEEMGALFKSRYERLGARVRQ
jgi:hypothetical protein